MTDNIVAMNGVTPIEAREPYEPAIAGVKALLERLEDGEVQGVVAAYLNHDGTVSYFTYTRATSFSLLGAAFTAAHDLAGVINGEDDG